MAILVDYLCPGCRGRHEARVPSPPPARRQCPACGHWANRSWSSFALGRSGRSSEGSSGDPVAPGRPTASLCAANPDVPGLCHMSAEAGRLWVARARKDNRTLERELQRQEAAAGPSGEPTTTDAPQRSAVIHGHHHHHG